MALFEDPHTWPPDDLVGASFGMDPWVIVQAYRCGVFPMPLDGNLIGWYPPVRRGVLPLDAMKVSRSLRKSAQKYRVTFDVAFEQVIARCGDPNRPHGWISDDIVAMYKFLHEQGIVHSVEAWDGEGQLVGGLYGMEIGGLFAGESMFHDPQRGRDASKVALLALVDRLSAAGPAERLLDVQWSTEHLASLGVIEIPRATYLARLQVALALPATTWASGEPA